MVTHRDDPGEGAWFASVERLARERDMDVVTPDDALSPELAARVAALRPDFIFSFYYRRMLPGALLRTAGRGAYNMHGSLLPKYRGRAPVNWAVLRGERETGATLHEMVAKPDAGRIVDRMAVPILPDDLAIDVMRKVTVAAEVVLDRALPGLVDGTARLAAQDLAQGGYFGARRPEDGRIDWTQARTPDPRPGPRRGPALSGRLHHARDASPAPAAHPRARGRARSPARAPAGRRRGPPRGRLRARRGAAHPRCRPRRAPPLGTLVSGALRTRRRPPRRKSMKRLCILGVNGFIGHHLSQRILADTGWEVFGMDMGSNRIADLLANPRFHFFEGDITINKEWIEYHIRKCDVILPLVAIATPATYVREPLKVFELDFEANLPIIRSAVKYGKRILFPSTSEVYGMCADGEFDPYRSNLVLGPIDKQRWIYACSKQLMDRVIYAYGSHGTARLHAVPPVQLDRRRAGLDPDAQGRQLARDHPVPRPHRARRADQAGGRRRAETRLHLHRRRHRRADEHHREPGRRGERARSTTSATRRTTTRCANWRRMMLELAKAYPEYRENAARVKLVDVTSGEYYGKGYQDVQNRVPEIANTMKDLDWTPKVDMATALRRIYDAYRGQLDDARALAN